VRALELILNTVSINDVKKITQDYAESTENSFPFIKRIISLGCEISYNLFQKEKNNRYLEDFYYLSEHKKSFYLYRDYLKFSPRNIFLNPALVDRSKKILGLRGKLNFLKEKRLGDSIKIYENKLIENSLKWQEELSKVTTTNKSPFYNEKESSLSEAMQWSSNNSTSILSYLFTDSSLFSLIITPDSVDLIRHKSNDNLSQKINRYRNLIESFGSLQFEQEKIIQDSFQHLLNLSHQLYTSIFKPGSRILSDNIVIVPDSILFDLPYSTLCIKNTSSPTLQPDDFLISKKAIALHFSIHTLITTPKRVRPESPLLFIAPFQDRFQSGAKLFLPYSKTELQEVKRIVKIVSPNTDHRKGEILSKVESSGIVHVASHAFIDESHPSNYFLAVGTDIDDYECRVYLDEIYTLQKEPGLVVLNACETNRSSSVTQSFTRAFYLSGAGQVVSNNWRISDQSAISIVKQIYQNLSMGKSGMVSLSEGKRTYLKNHKGLALHPHYWGNLDIWGWDQSAVHLIKPGQNYQILLGIGALFLLLVLVWVKRETSRT